MTTREPKPGDALITLKGERTEIITVGFDDRGKGEQWIDAGRPGRVRSIILWEGPVSRVEWSNENRAWLVKRVTNIVRFVGGEWDQKRARVGLPVPGVIRIPGAVMDFVPAEHEWGGPSFTDHRYDWSGEEYRLSALPYPWKIAPT